MIIENPALIPADLWRLAEILGAALLFSIICYFLTRRYLVAGVAFLVLPLLVTGGLLREFHDAATGPGMKIAKGVGYFRAAYGAAIVISGASLLSVLAGWRTRRKRE